MDRDGLWLRQGARPGGKDLLRKNHEAVFTTWGRRANPLNLR
jgi:hypothetical protein